MTQTLSKKDKLKQDKIAGIVSISILALALVIGSIYFVNKTLDEKRISDLIATAPENCVVFPSGVSYPKNETLESIVIKMISSDDYTKKEKKEIIEIMAIQGIDTTNFVEAYNSVVKGLDISVPETISKYEQYDAVDGINDNFEIKNETPVIDFLKSEGLLTDDIEVIDRGETGMTMLGGKSATSYRNLYEAEKGFGTRLGLFLYSTSLENYEMVNAYTVGDEFLQCVYAVNRDGSKLTAVQDIEASEINTLTVKLSMNKESDELKEVYKEYNLIYTDTMTDIEPTKVDFYGEDAENRENAIIHMMCMDMDNGRSYVIHTANGIDNVTARSLIHELITNLQYVDDIVYEEPEY